MHSAAQGRLLALKAKLTHQVGLLDSERRFINARAAALQNKADQLQARGPATRLSSRRRHLLTSTSCGACATQEALFRERALSGKTRLRVLSCVAPCSPPHLVFRGA